MLDINKNISDNDEIVATFGCEVLINISDDDYQGSTFYLLREGKKYGILICGFGSCSGCDELLAINDDIRLSNDFGELVEYRDRLYNSIQWRTRQEMKEYVLTKDFNLEWYGHWSVGGDFITTVKNYFK